MFLKKLNIYQFKKGERDISTPSEIVNGTHTYTHTHTHTDTHTQRKRETHTDTERERERESGTHEA